eukprot:TRINITY_DN12857_c3_g1_i1.p1 TRINITY_DN12857_c3_g1~~TRINITY_DN12857_c3_g1_i1.p1  ORF type:complete len:620 (+),score=147.90 TRINITY_DN12857_c3_g1_i1:65-1861(+)
MAAEPAAAPSAAPAAAAGAAAAGPEAPEARAAAGKHADPAGEPEEFGPPVTVRARLPGGAEHTLELPHNARVHDLLRAAAGAAAAAGAPLQLPATVSVGGERLPLLARLADSPLSAAAVAGDLAPCAPGEKTELHEAARARKHEVVTELLEQGADPDAPDPDGLTPLWHALNPDLPFHFRTIKKGVAVISELLGRGACTEVVPASTHFSETPLLATCRRESTEFALELLNAGAVAATADRFGATPLHHAIVTASAETMDGAAGGEVPAWRRAYAVEANGRSDGLRAADYRREERRRHNREMQLELVQGLLRRGADPNARAGTEGGWRAETPLILACYYGSAECAAELLRCGAAPDAADSRGWGPLHFAARSWGNAASAAAGAGASPRTGSRAGSPRTAAARAAAAAGGEQLLRVLVRAGAKVGARSAEGYTPVALLQSRRQQSRGYLAAVAVLRCGTGAPWATEADWAAKEQRLAAPLPGGSPVASPAVGSPGFGTPPGGRITPPPAPPPPCAAQQPPQREDTEPVTPPTTPATPDHPAAAPAAAAPASTPAAAAAPAPAAAPAGTPTQAAGRAAPPPAPGPAPPAAGIGRGGYSSHR